MKSKKKIMPKIMASVALLAILIGIVGTWALVVIGSFSSSIEESASIVSSQELEKIINSLSWSTQTWWVLSWSTVE